MLIVRVKYSEARMKRYEGACEGVWNGRVKRFFFFFLDGKRVMHTSEMMVFF